MTGPRAAAPPTAAAAGTRGADAGPSSLPRGTLSSRAAPAPAVRPRDPRHRCRVRGRRRAPPRGPNHPASAPLPARTHPASGIVCFDGRLEECEERRDVASDPPRGQRGTNGSNSDNDPKNTGGDGGQGTPGADGADAERTSAGRNGKATGRDSRTTGRNTNPTGKNSTTSGRNGKSSGRSGRTPHPHDGAKSAKNGSSSISSTTGTPGTPVPARTRPAPRRSQAHVRRGAQRLHPAARRAVSGDARGRTPHLRVRAAARGCARRHRPSRRARRSRPPSAPPARRRCQTGSTTAGFAFTPPHGIPIISLTKEVALAGPDAHHAADADR